MTARWMIVAVGLASAWCGTASAETAEVSWPTFYRAGPGRNWTVLEEMSRGQSVDVLGCADAWCRVQNGRSVGYIEQSALLRPDQMPQKPATPGPAGCFESRRGGFRGGEVDRYCPR